MGYCNQTNLHEIILIYKCDWTYNSNLVRYKNSYDNFEHHNLAEDLSFRNKSHDLQGKNLSFA
jgi:hypothetical protein